MENAKIEKFNATFCVIYKHCAVVENGFSLLEIVKGKCSSWTKKTEFFCVKGPLANISFFFSIVVHDKNIFLKDIMQSIKTKALYRIFDLLCIIA